METVDAVVARFKPRGVVSGAELYLPISDGYDFIKAVLHVRGIVLGIEAIRLEGGKTHPMMDQIADFSILLESERATAVAASSEAATAFLDQLPDDGAIRVAFIVDSSSDWPH